jgi:hypothetical protein
MSYEAWGEPDDGPELPDGWLNEDDAAEALELLRAVDNYGVRSMMSEEWSGRLTDFLAQFPNRSK